MQEQTASHGSLLLTDQAPWVPFANGVVLELQSRRVGNYRYNSQWGRCSTNSGSSKRLDWDSQRRQTFSGPTIPSSTGRT
jgi:hypothetical protein